MIELSMDMPLRDWLLVAFFLVSGFCVAFKIGGYVTRLILLGFFCREKKLHDISWKLFSLAEMRFGILRGEQSYTIQGSEYQIRIMRKNTK